MDTPRSRRSSAERPQTPKTHRYEQLLAWEQGKIAAPKAPEGLFRGDGPAATDRGNPLALLEMMAVADDGRDAPADEDVAGTDADLPSLSAGLDGLGGAETMGEDEPEETPEEAARREAEEQEELEKMGDSGWKQYRLKQPVKTTDEAKTEFAAAAQLAVLTVEDVVASGHIWKPETPEYQKFWAHDEWPHRTGPPTDKPHVRRAGFSFDASRRRRGLRRGCSVERRVAAAPRVPRGSSEGGSRRGHVCSRCQQIVSARVDSAATATWMFRGDESRGGAAAAT